MSNRSIKGYGFDWRLISALGALDGLLVGGALETFRLMYERHRIEVFLEEAYRKGWMVGFRLTPVMNALTIIVCVVAFAAIAHLVFHYGGDRAKMLGLVWFASAMVALGTGYYMTPINPSRSLAVFNLILFAAISGLVYWLWVTRTRSWLLLW
ncbi:MAG: hypothetical protein ACMG6H_15070, partial [Acidobacteriota bacterium]